ncbi:MAG: NERD domain-containing protein [Hespellia sp.]|nr:NERD domain-containing protein [Hespellia sp.]
MENKFSIFNRMKEPEVLKADNSAEKQLEQLKDLAPFLTEEGKTLLDLDIKKLEYGITGEKNILFELKNSHMPMCIIHDLYLSDGENTAQIDYLVFTKKICFVLECKNLYGNIEINEKGEFIRSVNYGKFYRKEGIYSPVTQNQRHMDLLRKLKSDKKSNFISKVLSDWNFNGFYQAIVVLANPNTVLNDKKAPSDIKDKVIRADQLIGHIKKAVKASRELGYTDAEMRAWAKGILEWDTEVKADYLAKYEKFRINEAVTEAVTETVSVTVAESPSKMEKISETDYTELFAELKKFRLEKSRAEGIKPYYICTDKQLELLIQRMPGSEKELLEVPGFGAKKVEKYGADLLDAVREFKVRQG